MKRFVIFLISLFSVVILCAQTHDTDVWTVFGDAEIVNGNKGWDVTVTANNNSISDTEEVVYCSSFAGTNVTLSAPNGQYVNYRWKQKTGNEWQVISNGDLLQSITLPMSVSDTLYYCFEARKLLGNLINNGDFEQGNTGFETSYNYSDNIFAEGNYTITDDVHKAHGNAQCNSDHTSGNGLMMAVNGGSNANANVWTQTIENLQPHTDYAFSAWAANWTDYHYNFAELEFSINDVLQGERFSPQAGTCNWTQIYTIWNSGNNTSAKIRLVDQQTGLVANDFCVDDIYFSPLSGGEGSYVVYYKVYLTDGYETKLKDTTICFGETLIWNNVEYTESGTLTQSFKSIIGCDSIVTRQLTILPKSEGHESKTIYKGDTYSWNGKQYDATDVYSAEGLTDRNGCDSTAYLHLTVSDKAVVSRAETVTLCEGEKYAFYGETLTAVNTNTYTHRLSGEEADTLVTLTMTVLSVKRTTLESVTLCEGETFTWNGTPYTTSGTYTQTFTASNNCDSIVTQTLFFAPVYDNVKDHKHVYTGMTYTWQGETYSESTEVTKTLHTVYGCDSVVTLILTVSDKPLETREVNAVICEGETYNFYGEVFASATDYTVTREGEEADTLVTLHLSVLTRYEGIEFEVYMCEGREYVWNDESFVAAGDYTRTLKSTAGCDSVVTLHLNTYPRYDLITIDDTITDGMSYTWDGRTYTASGNYPYTYQTINGCDSIVTLRLYNNKIEVSRVEIAEQCAGEGALEVVVEMSGVAHQVRLLFDEKAHEAGLRDTSVAVISGMATVPYKARAGRFGCEVQLLFRGGVAFSRYEPVVLLYPSSVLEQAWNDVVAVLTHDYNGGYDFVSFYWYEDGQALIGETGSYLYRPLKMGSEYSALLTDVTGLQMMTCPLVATEQTDISLYPTFVQRRGRTRCHVTDDAMLYIYDSTGSCCYSAAVSQGDTVIEMPEVSGIYMVRIVTRKANKVKTYKMMVE